MRRPSDKRGGETLIAVFSFAMMFLAAEQGDMVIVGMMGVVLGLTTGLIVLKSANRRGRR